MTSLYYLTSTKYHPCGNWLLDFTPTPDRLTVFCDYPALIAARLDVSLCRAHWQVDGRTYLTVAFAIEGDRITFWANVVVEDHTKIVRALDRWIDHYTGRMER